jgi:metacaspase-1
LAYAAPSRGHPEETTLATTTPAASKPRGLSLHIGLNSVSTSHYGGWSGDLSACEFDAKDMAALATGRGIKPTVLLTKDGTRAKTLAALRGAAKKLVKGDFFFLTFSGHGGQVPDVSGEEADKLDETWCLYDGQLIDDELYNELGSFATGVRILVLSDSCHSGTVVRAGPPSGAAAAPELRSKMMPPSVAMRTYEAHKAFYDKLQQDVAKATAGESKAEPDEVLAALTVSTRLTKIARRFKARAILISGCQDNQSSYDGAHNGAFTGRLLTVWNRGNFDGNYATFHSHIKSGMPAIQTPNLFTMGAVASFMKQKPFSV